MNITKSAACVLVMLAGWAWSSAFAQGAAPAAAASASEPALTGQGVEYSAKGADTCLGCHDDEGATYSGSAIFKTKHGQRSDKRSPFGVGGLQCEACHGPGARHAAKGSKKALTINSFKADSFIPVAQRNEACMTCHKGRSLNEWHAGAHDRVQLACTDCHKVHATHDAVRATKTQPEVCYSCHQQQHADFNKSSAHPVRFGRMACSDCHNAHGTTNPALLVKPTINQTCYSCHAEKRGPLLWEHAPVAEDCTLCHVSHGAVRSGLLAKSPPLLCQQCHATAGHPSVARTGAALPGSDAGGQIFLLAGSCTNCHSQVHGSNHPSGAKLMR